MLPNHDPDGRSVQCLAAGPTFIAFGLCKVLNKDKFGNANETSIFIYAFPRVLFDATFVIVYFNSNYAHVPKYDVTMSCTQLQYCPCSIKCKKLKLYQEH
ncbi:hypothetical protein L596_019470 [Steinernema carpocapsae]|uniref:Uncharacterized protein n=1 Tax=Steinernema carpocapsae TaxID=34508 RepID=A0A4U5MR50_STECR|nr:hypothetical protein L596_019470 [Steinernema carpocapsae]